MKVSLKAARVNAGLRQTDVAAALNVSPISVSNWESGKTSPKIKVLQKMCSLYGVDIDGIFLPDESSLT